MIKNAAKILAFPVMLIAAALIGAVALFDWVTARPPKPRPPSPLAPPERRTRKTRDEVSPGCAVAPDRGVR